MPDRLDVLAIDPEIIAILVYDEYLGRQAQRDQPLPLRHDRFARANHPYKRVIARAQLPYELIMAVGGFVIGDAINGRFRPETSRNASIARSPDRIGISRAQLVRRCGSNPSISERAPLSISRTLVGGGSRKLRKYRTQNTISILTPIIRNCGVSEVSS